MAEKNKGIPLSQAYPYLRDKERRKQLFDFLAYESSVFEGATGLERPSFHLKSPKKPSATRSTVLVHRSSASTKKRVSGS
jgi:hypothetical protein